MAITPRHYLDFIHHFVKLHNEKRSDLEEQQLHLNVGLSKIAETVEQVEEMQKSLAVKSQVSRFVRLNDEKINFIAVFQRRAFFVPSVFWHA